MDGIGRWEEMMLVGEKERLQSRRGKVYAI